MHEISYKPQIYNENVSLYQWLHVIFFSQLSPFHPLLHLQMYSFPLSSSEQVPPLRHGLESQVWERMAQLNEHETIRHLYLKKALCTQANKKARFTVISPCIKPFSGASPFVAQI